MADIPRITALNGHITPGEFGAITNGAPGITLSECRPNSIAQVNGGGEGSAPSSSDWVSLWNGPGQWLVVSNTLSSGELVSQLETTLADTRASVTDLSHARSVTRVEGTPVRDLLAKLCPLDIDSLRPGDCATSLFGQLTALVHCTGDECLELYVFRSFGLEMWEMLFDEALEFGVRVAE